MTSLGRLTDSGCILSKRTVAGARLPLASMVRKTRMGEGERTRA